MHQVLRRQRRRLQLPRILNRSRAAADWFTRYTHSFVPGFPYYSRDFCDDRPHDEIMQDQRSIVSARFALASLLVLTICVMIGFNDPVSAASPVSGNQCKKKQHGVSISGLSCQKQGTKYVWSRSVPAETKSSTCDPNYDPCVPIASDVDCAGGSGNGPAYVQGPVRVIGVDIYGLDRDGNSVGCESH